MDSKLILVVSKYFYVLLTLFLEECVNGIGVEATYFCDSKKRWIRH